MRCSYGRHTGSLEVDRFALFSLNLGPRTSALPCGFNGSLQHLNFNYREEDIKNELSNKDLLHRRAEENDASNHTGNRENLEGLTDV